MLGIFLQELSRGAVRKVHAADLRRGQVALSLRNGVDLNMAYRKIYSLALYQRKVGSSASVAVVRRLRQRSFAYVS